MSDVSIVFNKLLAGWFVVRGPHQTPISGKFTTKEAARASLRKPDTLITEHPPCARSASKRVTLRAINTELQKEFPEVELVRGAGYFYFAGGASCGWRAESVYTYHLTSYSIDEWLQIARDMAADRHW